MPIIDKKIGLDKEEYKVSKKGLDPFGAERQALDLIRMERSAPMGPNTAGLDYGIEDRGDYYKVTVESEELTAGPRGIAKARGMVGSGKQGKGQGETDPRGLNVAEDAILSADKPQSQSSGMDGEGETGSFDLQSRLNSLYTVPELRREARRAGVYVSTTMRKDEIIEQMARRAPLRARRLAGR